MPVPPALTGLPGTRAVNVLGALLDLAWCTRPPVVHGFSLADLWAWLRYMPALSGDRELRLRAEWNEIDSHQKTLLSDDFGVAFGVHVLRNHLKIPILADTRWLLRYLIGRYALRVPRRRRGPRKAPDFFFFTSRGESGVLECKGSQTSLRGLRSAMAAGIAQKRNVVATAHRTIVYSLVSGIFVPGESVGTLRPVLIFIDPEDSALGRAIAQIPLNEQRRAVRLVAAAQAFSLAGLHVTASLLLRETREVSLEDFNSSVTRDLASLVPRAKQAGEPTYEILNIVVRPTRGTPFRFRMDAQVRVEGSRFLTWLGNESENVDERLPVTESETTAELELPFGLSIRLSAVEGEL